MAEHKRRKSDVIDDPKYLEGLTERSVEDLKSMRDDCVALENEVSYERRMCHARMDLLSAELDHRAGKAEDVISRLPEILAAESREENSPMPNRAPDLSVPENAGGPRRRIDEVSGGRTLAELLVMEPEEIKKLIDSLADYEKKLSEQRTKLHEVLDQIQAELVSRYTKGEASSDAIMGR
ncbi:MAG TPA: hypothetical protein VE174_12575 [Actinomycetota bacterium]|nr:hypothetical protein [Actinomycetota bacterium]